MLQSMALGWRKEWCKVGCKLMECRRVGVALRHAYRYANFPWSTCCVDVVPPCVGVVEQRANYKFYEFHFSCQYQQAESLSLFILRNNMNLIVSPSMLESLRGSGLLFQAQTLC